MDIDSIRSAVTVLSLMAYAGIAVWAYMPSHRARFDRDALMPFSHRDDAPEVARTGAASIPATTPERDPR
jgi:cbb3-type cytochrome oxidase subunit 3